MHTHGIEPWTHSHVFNPAKRDSEKKTLIVVAITLVMMAAEISSGWLFRSMALFADGWHMGTHAFALGLSFFAFLFARRYAEDRRFVFGTWKIEILGGYTSAIVLGLAGLSMAWISVERMRHPVEIRYNEALLIAIVGLIVNLVCAFILDAGRHDNHDEDHHHPHDHDEGNHHHHRHHDLNMRSAYLHVVADAMTSVLAILALLGAKLMHWNFLDPAMGILGALLILRWTVGLLRDTGSILLDREVRSELGRSIRRETESDGDSRVSDLHLWRISQERFACILSVVSADARTAEEYKERLEKFRELAHVTVELNECGCKNRPHP